MLAETDTAGIVITRVSRADPRLTDIQRLRYEVYCLEREYLNVEDFPERLESDDHDRIAYHFGAWHAGRLIATVRLVPDSSLGFPMERFAPSLVLEAAGVRRHRTGELSRLVLAREYRRSATPEGLRLMLRLFQAVFAESLRLEIETFIAALEPSLMRLLRRLGFVLAPIGRPFDWYGMVMPCAVVAMPPTLLGMAPWERRRSRETADGDLVEACRASAWRKPPADQVA
jgi:N-acyl-L-homoserine lactone synthetase